MKQINFSTTVYTKLIKTTDLLGKVNVQLAKMENPYLLTYLLEAIDTIASNQVENIHTTVDEAFDDVIKNHQSPYTLYREALKVAHQRLINQELIRAKDIVWINSRLRGKKIGFRKTPVSIKDGQGKIVHKGVGANKIAEEIAQLVQDINEDWNINAIVKALLIHHNFERIHPFTDGNGRTGRILFALLLFKYEILNIPASVFSYSVSRNKSQYYQALKLADEKKYNQYLEIMLEILIESLQVTINFAKELNNKLEQLLGVEIIAENEKLQEIVKWCFVGVKVSIGYLERKTHFNNKTLVKYLQILIDMGLVVQEVRGKFRPYKNLVIEKLLNTYFNLNKN